MAEDTYQPDSTNIDSARYDPDTQVMVVTFLRSGADYTFNNITAQEWAAFKAAPSAGRFFNQNFKDRF